MGVIALVRHGQASWGAADYDVLSDRGGEQAGVTGRWLAGADVAPALVVHGAMRRQRDTAAALVAAAGWDVEVREDPRWDEMDHQALLDRARPPEGVSDEGPDRAQFQAWFERATDRWLHGDADDDYDEPWPAFDDRVQAALADLRDVARDGTVVVVTSGGPVAAVAGGLLDGGRATYARVAPVVVNASVTRVLVGRRGLTLLTLNEHAHLTGDLLTYR